MKISTSKSESMVLSQKRAVCSLYVIGKYLNLPGGFRYCVFGSYSQVMENMNVRLTNGLSQQQQCYSCYTVLQWWSRNLACEQSSLFTRHSASLSFPTMILSCFKYRWQKWGYIIGLLGLISMIRREAWQSEYSLCYSKMRSHLQWFGLLTRIQLWDTV